MLCMRKCCLVVKLMNMNMYKIQILNYLIYSNECCIIIIQYEYVVNRSDNNQHL